MLLATALDQLASGALRRLAAAHAVHHDDAATRAELIARLCERFSDTQYLRAQLAALSATEHAALLSTAAAGGEIRRFVLDRDFPDAEAALLERGFLIRTFTTSGRRRGEVFQIPDELRALLPAPAEDLSPPDAAPGPPPAERRTSDPVFSVFALVSTLQRPSAQLEAEVRGWAEEPGGWDWRARWRCLQHLAQACGLLAVGADGRLAPSRTLERRLAAPPDLTQRLWRAYVETRTWSELNVLEPDVLIDVAPPDPVLVRTRVLELVERLPEGAWFELTAVAGWLHHTAPDFLREHLDPRARLALEARAWDELEGRLIRAMLLGPLYWLGRMAVSADGRLLARRIAPPGGASPPEPCAWSSGSTLIAPARADLGALLHAERYLVLEERSRASRYRLDQQHVAAALARGGSIGECRRLLERLTQGALPPAIEAQLNAWDAAFGALLLRPAVVLEARSEALLDSLLTLEAIRPFVRRRLGATVVDVPAAEVIGLVDALRTAGHLPRVDAALRLVAESRGAYAERAAEPGRGSAVPRQAPAERSAQPDRAFAKQAVQPGRGSAESRQASAERAAEPGRGAAVPGQASAEQAVQPGRGSAESRQASAERSAEPGRGAAVPGQASAERAVQPGRGSAESRQASAERSAEPGRGSAESRQASAEQAVQPGRGSAESRQASAERAAEPGRGAAESRQASAERSAEPGGGSAESRQASAERSAEPGRAYAGLVDEQVLEFLLVSLLAFSEARPERLAELEGALGLLERLERQFGSERLSELRADARRVAGDLRATPTSAAPPARRRRPRAPRSGPTRPRSA